MNLHAERGCTRFATPGRFRSFPEVKGYLDGCDLTTARRIAGDLRRQSRRNEDLVVWLFKLMDARTSVQRLSGLRARLCREQTARAFVGLAREEAANGREELP